MSAINDFLKIYRDLLNSTLSNPRHQQKKASHAANYGMGSTSSFMGGFGGGKSFANNLKKPPSTSTVGYYSGMDIESISIDEIEEAINEALGEEFKPKELTIEDVDKIYVSKDKTHWYVAEDASFPEINEIHEVDKNIWLKIMAKIPFLSRNFNALEERTKLLQYYIEIFNEVPSGSHMVRAYNLMEKIVLEKYQKSQITIEDKVIEKFDKLKNLALNNENVNERKLAFYNSAKIYMKIADIKLNLPEF